MVYFWDDNVSTLSNNVFYMKIAQAVEICSEFNHRHAPSFVTMWPVISPGATTQNSAVMTVVATGTTSLLLQ